MEYKFSDIFSWESGKPVIQTNGSVPVYGSNGIIGFTDIPKYKDKIILGRVGAYCGSVEYCKTDFNATDNTLVTTCDTSKILYGYAYYLLKQYKLNEYSGGSAQPLITQGLLKHLKCNLPSLAFQEKIISILDKYEKIIENNNKRIKKLEQMAENLYKEWFVRFRFPGYENAEFENGIPKDWDVLKVSDIALIKAGGDRPVVFSDIITEKCSIPVYSNGLEKEGLYGYTDKAIIHDESITISARGTVGFVCYRRTPFVPIVRLIAIVPNIEIVTPLYMFYYFKNDSIIANGTSQQQITIPMVSRKKVLLPSKKVLQEFGNLEKPLWNCIDRLKEKNENLIKQRDLLLPRLMSGKLEV